MVRTESLTDPLTGARQPQALRRAAGAGDRRKRPSAAKPLSLVMTDIDHFKAFNDTWGHLTGDQVLRLVAMSLKQNVKGQDIAARYGGEEFARDPAEHGAALGADRRRPHPPRGHVEGTDEALDRPEPRPRDDLARRRDRCTRATPRRSLIARADACLYAAKRNGRNRVICETDPEFSAPAETKVA